VTDLALNMKKIAAFIDFTEGCKIALSQAAVMAHKTQAEMYVVYIMNDDSDPAAKQIEMLDFAKQLPNMPNNMIAVAGHGDLLEGAKQVLRHIDPDFVVVGTHGIKGMMQHLFGAHILKLVQAIPYPCIVVQENTVVNPDGFSSILFPVGSHPAYDVKIAQASKLAKIFDSEVVQYEIDKSTGVDDMIKRNSRDSKAFFEANHTKYRFVLEDATVMSVGYSRQTIKFANDNHMGIIALMSDVPATEAFYGKADKENFLTNPSGIPVLCCNQ
jgi:nucleotide-binding universal stress UspA family protein